MSIVAMTWSYAVPAAESGHPSMIIDFSPPVTVTYRTDFTDLGLFQVHLLLSSTERVFVCL